MPRKSKISVAQKQEAIMKLLRREEPAAVPTLLMPSELEDDFGVELCGAVANLAVGDGLHCVAQCCEVADGLARVEHEASEALARRFGQ